MIDSDLDSVSTAALLVATASVVGRHPTPSLRLALKTDSCARANHSFCTSVLFGYGIVLL